MSKSIKQIEADFEELNAKGTHLWNAIRNEQMPEVIEAHFKEVLKLDYQKFAKALPDFRTAYPGWYSQALAVMSFAMPERLNDFKRLYEVPKGRKSVTPEHYVIEDYLNKLEVTGGFENKVIAGPIDALPLFETQLNMVKSLSERFKTTLFDMRQLIQAELFDAELDAAEALIKIKQYRAAGAICDLVLKRHLVQVLENRQIKPLKKTAKVMDFNQVLKTAGVIDFATFRFITALSDLGVVCMKEKKREPTDDEISDFINGVDKVLKTVL